MDCLQNVFSWWQGHNIVLISNHQTEADPAVIALLLETSSPHIAENLVNLILSILACWKELFCVFEMLP